MDPPLASASGPAETAPCFARGMCLGELRINSPFDFIAEKSELFRGKVFG